MVQKII